MKILISDNGDMSWDSIKSYLAEWNCTYEECSPNLNSTNEVKDVN